jgi:hypothetical protein
MITFAGGHRVFTDNIHGVGMIVRPDPARDMAYPGATSRQATEWDSVVIRLRATGWELVPGRRGGDRQLIGATADGCEAFALRWVAPQASGEPAVGEPDAVRVEQAMRMLCEAAGVTPVLDD